ncbi:MAG TPA: TerB family tellurite resistance protein [Gammaproteobacteria bacterium]|nr:TerB family tellurite resistance protein [Gammaproteobacteria bacterium]
MIQSFMQRLYQQIGGHQGGQSPEEEARALQLSTAALLVEVARADQYFDEREREHLATLVSTEYGFSAEETAALLTQAKEKVEDSVSLTEFTGLLNTQLDAQQKFRLMEHLWEVAYADGRLDKYEEYLLRKLADLLYIDHERFIRAKLNVLNRDERNG